MRVAVAAGAAFTFTYTDTLDALAAAGAEPVPFDPLRDRALPEAVDGLIAGGGFPEVYAADLAANRPLLDDVRRRVGGRAADLGRVRRAAVAVPDPRRPVDGRGRPGRRPR